AARAEYYGFALIAPALFAAASEWAFMGRKLDRRVPAEWRDDMLALARVSVAVGAALVSVAAIAGSRPDVIYRPDSHVYLPISFALIAAFFALDASREKRVELSAALLASLAGVGAGIVYGARLDAEYYGVAFVSAGFVF